MSGTAKSNPSRTASPSQTPEQTLAKMLAIIKDHPGIRPSELNRRLNMQQSDSQRAVLIRRGLVRKVKDGQATHLYAN